MLKQVIRDMLCVAPKCLQQTQENTGVAITKTHFKFIPLYFISNVPAVCIRKLGSFIIALTYMTVV